MRDKYTFVPAAVIAGTHQHLVDSIVAVFTGNKRRRKEYSVSDLQSLSRRLANPGAMDGAQIHNALHIYEQDYLKHGGNWPKLKGLLRLRFSPNIRFVEIANLCTIYGTVTGHGERVLGTVQLGDTRFVPIAVQPFANNPTIYERVGDPLRHYILLTTSATFVRRFVTRGLNGFDGMNLTANQPLLAALVANDNATANEVGGIKHGVGQGTALSIQEQILSHTRGWKKRFISAGVSNRQVHSTRGTQFISMYGVVVIDLARVPFGIIYDVHRPDVAATQLARPALDVVTFTAHLAVHDLAEQRYLALRDVLRTREILIKGTVPAAAVVSVVEGRKLLGIGSQTGGEHNGVPAQVLALPDNIRARIVEQDITTFRDENTNRKWHFIAFADPASALFAHNAFVLAGNQIKVRFNKYNPGPQPVGMLPA